MQGLPMCAGSCADPSQECMLVSLSSKQCLCLGRKDAPVEIDGQHEAKHPFRGSFRPLRR